MIVPIGRGQKSGLLHPFWGATAGEAVDHAITLKKALSSFDLYHS